MLDVDIIKKKFNKGDIFFISDFTELGSYEAIRKALQRLTTEEEIGRIAKGIYFLPKKHERFGIMFPHAEQIAEAIAKRDKARIIPTGITAFNQTRTFYSDPFKIRLSNRWICSHSNHL